MMNEGYRPPVMEQWREEILAGVENIKQIPESVLQKGPTYEVTTKAGEKLHCETYALDLEEVNSKGITGIKNPNVGNERDYLIALDASGQVVGTRTTSLFFRDKDIEARSIIKVMKKGGGYASPIEEAFQHQLQLIANQKGKPVVWRVSNQNLEELEAYRNGPSVDPEVLHRLEEEQKRWMTLYGEGGKLQIQKGKKIFTPKSGIIEKN